MHAKPENIDTSQPPPYPRRFSWPMRLFLTVFIFCLVFRCLHILFPMGDWSSRYAVDVYPPPLPALMESKASFPHEVPDNDLFSAKAVWAYLNPWPSPESRKRIESRWDALK